MKNDASFTGAALMDRGSLEDVDKPLAFAGGDCFRG